MEQGQRRAASVPASRSFQFHPARSAISDLFNLYLGRNGSQKADDSHHEIPNKMQGRVVSLNKEFPPCDEQFLPDFEQIRSHFLQDQDQLFIITESVVASVVVQCCNHAQQADFLLFSIQSFCNMGYIKWDTFLPCLLYSIMSAEMSVCQAGQTAVPDPSPVLSQIGALASSGAISNSNNFQSLNPSPSPPVHGVGSPGQTMIEPSSSPSALSVKSSDLFGNVQQSIKNFSSSGVDSSLSSLWHLCCKIFLSSLEFNLKPGTHAIIFYHILNWMVNLDQRAHGIGESEGASLRKIDKTLLKCLHGYLDVMWLLVDEDKCRVPFYELLRSELQFIENITDDDALFTLVLEIHLRRDKMAMHMQMLDQFLHCPTFGTHRILTQTTPNVAAETAAVNLRFSPISYSSLLGEPLHGEDFANSVRRGSLDWERALRCLGHAFRTTPSPDWWKRVLLVAPCYRNTAPGPTPGAVFTPAMICEATINRITDLLKLTNSGKNCWQEWIAFSDIVYFLAKSGCIDLVDFVDKLVSLFATSPELLQTNHVTWLFAQVTRLELVMNALTTDSRKMETTRKIVSFHREDLSSDSATPRGLLLEFISSCQSLRIWSLNTATREYLNNEQLQKGKQIDDWWRQVNKGDHLLDYMNMDDKSIGMFWVVSYTMAQPACETMISWLSSAGVSEMLPGTSVPPTERLMAVREVNPLSMSLLSGLSINLCQKLVFQMEDSLFAGPVVPSIAMVETYCRLLLLTPHSLFRSHFNHLAQRYPSLWSKPGATLLLLEILNYRLLPFYRYQGKSKYLLYDITKVVSSLKAKRGDHRVFRLAENVCLNLILSQRDFFSVKREGKGPTDFTESLNRAVIFTLSVFIKTRGIADADHLLYLQTMVEQIMSTSQHTWSEKTLRYFPPLLLDALTVRVDKRSMTIQAWQQAEMTVINQCTQLLSPSADPTYVVTYINHSFPQHRQYLCSGAWILMQGRPENINSGNLARVLREFSPEEVTANIYTMVDVLLHHIHVELKLGHSLQDILLKTIANLSFLVWTHELLPADILFLALADRDDDVNALHIVVSLLDSQELQQRVQIFCMNRGPPEHWLYSGIYQRLEAIKVLGNHLSWKDRFPIFFDDCTARFLPIILMIVYRLVENEAIDSADKIMAVYSPFLAYYPLRFTFVHDILAYFYGHLPRKLIVRILNVLDLSKIPLSESFPRHINLSNPVTCPPPEYFSTLLVRLVNNVVPQLGSASNYGSGSSPCASDCQVPFYEIQDPGTRAQLLLETTVIELLSLPVSASSIVSSLVQIVVNIQPTLVQSGGAAARVPHQQGVGEAASAGNSDTFSSGRSTPANLVLQSGYTWQQLSPLLIQACGLLLAQLPPEFHLQLYAETSGMIKERWWLIDGNKSVRELDCAVGYAVFSPTWAAEDSTSTPIGNIIALLHSIFSNLPQEWLEGTHMIINHLRPITSVSMLRIVFRLMGPLLPRLINAHSLFNKILSLLLSVLVDVFGKNLQPSNHAKASDIIDLIDFIYHIVHYEGQGGPVQASSKPRPEVLALCWRAVENLRPDVQRLLAHLKPDPNSSIYASSTNHVPVPNC